MSVTQSIPTTTLTGQHTFSFTNTAQPWNQAVVTLDRTGSGNHPWLNTLTPADTLGISIQYSTDGGATWHDCGTDTCTGGSEVVKGVVVPLTNVFGVSAGVPFPTGTAFQVVTTASTSITISGTILYDSP